MASPPTSRLAFIALDGSPVERPLEWTPGFVEMRVPVESWTNARLLRQGQPMTVIARDVGGRPRVVAEWPRSGTGHYALRFELAGEPMAAESVVWTVPPRKITEAAYGALLSDLEERLPISVAIGLHRAGALTGIDLVAPSETTIPQELLRLRRAVEGARETGGLAGALEEIAHRPHQILRTHETWNPRHRARRVHPSRLTEAFARGYNVDPDRLPNRLPELRVEHTFDVYENQILKTFHDQVAWRIARLIAALEARGSSLAPDGRELAARLARARRTAAFLNSVRVPDAPGSHVTMVLAKRPDYRRAFRAFLEFRRAAAVRFYDPALESPLENLPSLYETWGVLQVIDALLEVAASYELRVVEQRLVHRRGGELYVEVLRDGRPAVTLAAEGAATRVILIPQQTYSVAGTPARSVSFNQRPDVAVEIRSARGASPAIYLFDPKYKLQSEEAGSAVARVPLKPDIDAMHSYRDSIRDQHGRRVVRYAAILYPGDAQHYTRGLEALPANPDDPVPLRAHLQRVLSEALAMATAV